MAAEAVGAARCRPGQVGSGRRTPSAGPRRGRRRTPRGRAPGPPRGAPRREGAGGQVLNRALPAGHNSRPDPFRSAAAGSARIRTSSPAVDEAALDVDARGRPASRRGPRNGGARPASRPRSARAPRRRSACRARGRAARGPPGSCRSTRARRRSARRRRTPRRARPGRPTRKSLGPRERSSRQSPSVWFQPLARESRRPSARSASVMSRKSRRGSPSVTASLLYRAGAGEHEVAEGPGVVEARHGRGRPRREHGVLLRVRLSARPLDAEDVEAPGVAGLRRQRDACPPRAGRAARATGETRSPSSPAPAPALSSGRTRVSSPARFQSMSPFLSGHGEIIRRSHTTFAGLTSSS